MNTDTPQQSNDVPRAEHDRVLRELNHQQQANYKLDWHASEARCAALNAKIAMLRNALKCAAESAAKWLCDLLNDKAE
jgi:hypothetical protein